MSSRRFRIWARIETSSADTGSSQITSSGSRISARAMQMRWHWPPENSCGRRPVTRSASRPTAVSTSRTRRSRSALSVTPMMISGSATMSPMQRRGLSEAIGSWKISCRRRRIRRILSAASPVSSVPSNTTLPAVGRRSCRTARPKVDLPQPDSPTRPKVSPLPTSQAHIGHRRQRLAADGVFDDQVLDGEQRGHSGCQQAKRPPARSGSASGGLASRQRSSA